MPRPLFALPFLALALLPDRAAAFGCGHPFFAARWFAGPVYVAPPPVVFVPEYVVPVPCCPAPVVPYSPSPTASPLAPPRVEQVPAGKAEAPPPRDRTSSDAPVGGREVEPSGGVAVPHPADPTPKEKSIAPPVPPISIPKEPAPMPRAPGVSKESSEVPKTPPVVPALSGDPDAAPLKLQIPTSANKSESRSSPLTAGRPGPRVEVIPADGPAVAFGTLRTVGFYNRTDRDVTLTVQGEATRLPAGHYITARVPAGFRWKLGNESERTAEVPAGSPGVEVVIRK